MKFLKIKDVTTPLRANSTDAGIDLFIPNDFIKTDVNPGESILIPAGIKVNVPEGHTLIAMNKSGVAAKRSLIVGACVIDEGYMGEIHIDLKNVGTEIQTLNPGDKITQILCIPVNYVTVEEVMTEYDLFEGKVTDRGEGGFGSTNIK